MDRVLRNTSATLEVVFYSDEAAVDADGAVTVTVTDEAGVAIVTNGPTTHGATGHYSYTLPAQAACMKLILAWTGTFSAVMQTLRTEAEVVGRRIFSYAELRGFDSELDNDTKYPTDDLEQVRVEVEDEFEQITGRCFIKRWGRSELIGGGGRSLRRLRHYDVDAVVRATIDGSALSGGALATLRVEPGRVVFYPAGVWTERAKVLVDYEYGVDTLDSVVRDAALLRARHRLNRKHTGIADMATSFDAPDGATTDLSLAGLDRTGIPEVDAVLARYLTDEKRAAADAARAAAS